MLSEYQVMDAGGLDSPGGFGPRTPARCRAHGPGPGPSPRSPPARGGTRPRRPCGGPPALLRALWWRAWGACAPLFALSAWPLAPGPLPLRGPAPARRARPFAPPGRPPRSSARGSCGLAPSSPARSGSWGLRSPSLLSGLALLPPRSGSGSRLRPWPLAGPPRPLLRRGAPAPGACPLRPSGLRGLLGPAPGAPARAPCALALRRGFLRRGFAGGSRRPRAPAGVASEIVRGLTKMVPLRPPAPPPPRGLRGAQGRRGAVDILSNVNRPQTGSARPPGALAVRMDLRSIRTAWGARQFG